MTAYAVVLTPEAARDIRVLDASVRSRILNKLEWMGQNARLLTHRSLRGERWADCFRYRFGDFRIIYQMKALKRQIVVLKVAHRKDVYE